MYTMCLAALLAVTSPAPSPDSNADTVVFSEKDRADALAALKSIASKLETPPPAPTADGKAAPTKSMADVADKALEMSAKYIAQIAGLMEKAAPRVWKVMIVQQYAKGIAGILAPFGCILLMVIMIFASRKAWHEPVTNKHQGDKAIPVVDYDCDEYTARQIITLILPMILTLLFGFWFALNLVDSAMYLINPEYYAVKDLFKLLFGNGSL
jgi:hypothetical protein